MQFNNKVAIAQDLLLHDAITKRAAGLMQLSSGLSILGVLDKMKMFPELFEKYFVHEKKEISADVFLKCVQFPESPSDEVARVISIFSEFVMTLNKEGL